MKKTIAISICIVCMLLQQTIACTTFFLNKNGHLIFGRNYDWVSDAGMVCTNLKGLSKTSINIENSTPVSWVSKYGSITFNQYGKELPTGGMNEKGLVVELMWADGSKYPAADKRPGLHLLQWIQYQLDNHSTIDEVIASDNQIRVSFNNPPCHFLVADVSGKAATIEFFDGKMIVHTGKDLPFPVLTNSPYSESIKTADSINVAAGNTDFTFQDNSLQRFNKACSMVQQFNTNKINKPIVDYAFNILDNVAVTGFTKWSIVYDLKNKTIYFKTANYQDVKSFSFDAFDFTCSATAMAVNMNQVMSGNVSKNFLATTDAINREVMEKAIAESKSQVQISEEIKEANLAYAKGITCGK